MSRDTAIKRWLASMSESELIDQCFFWHDMALGQGRRYNAVKAENVKLRASNEVIAEDHAALCEHNAKLRELAKGLYEFAYAEYPRAAKAGFADDLRELGVEVDG